MKARERKDWNKLVEQWRLSGLSKRQFCKEQSISYPRFIYWSTNRTKDKSVSSRPEVPKLLPISLKAPDTHKANTQLPAVSPWAELQFPNGLEVRLFKGAGGAQLSGLLNAVRQQDA